MKLHHRILGQGQPFVILHGLFGFSDNWQTHAKKLADYYQVILVDQRNHGHSEWSDDFSYNLLVEDLKEMFDDLRLEKVILMGHSMGGKAAMLFAQMYPGLLEKLIIVDMGVKAYAPHHDQILAGLHAVDTGKMTTRTEAENAMALHVDSFGVRQFLLKNLYWKEKGKLAWRMNIKVLEMEMKSILSALPDQEVFLPTLFIRGELSDYILDDDIPLLENQFPDAQIVTIQGAGHWVHAEAPDDFMETVLSFCLR